MKKSIGVLRLDYEYPSIVGDVDDPYSFGYEVHYIKVGGLTSEAVQSALITEEIKANLKKAVTELESKKVLGISSDCGFLLYLQEIVAEMTTIPVFMSSLSQMPLVKAVLPKESKVAVFTANKYSLKRNQERLFHYCGFDVNDDRYIVVGLEDQPGFDAVRLGHRVDAKVMVESMLRVTKIVMLNVPEIRAILFECSELPHYAPAMRRATQLPVFDIITLIDYIVTSKSTDAW